MASKQAEIRSAVENSDHVFNDKEVQGYLSQTPEINSTGRAHVQSAIDTSGLKTSQYLNTQFEAYKKDANDHLKQNDNSIASREQSLGAAQKTNKDKFTIASEESNYTHLRQKQGDNVISNPLRGGHYGISGDFQSDSNSVPDNPLDRAANLRKSKENKVTPAHTSEKNTQAQKDFDAINKGKK